MTQDLELQIVSDWIEAVNRRDLPALLALSQPEIEIIGPRGKAIGHAVLSDWLARAGLSFETRRIWREADRIFAEQHGVWAPGFEGPAGEADFVSVFRLSQGKVSEYERRSAKASADASTS